MAFRVIVGDCTDTLKTLDAASVQCCVTSPPYYGLRDYGVTGQIGLEETPDAYVARLVDVFREVRRVLRDDGTLWLNLGDSYMNVSNKRIDRIKPKDLLGIPWMVAFALRADGWWLRSSIIWAKPNPMPESIRDRPTSAHELVFLLSKQPRYFYDADAIREPPTEGSADAYRAALENPRQDRAYQHDSESRMGKRSANRAWSDPETLKRLLEGRNARNVWTIATQPYSGAHFATMPPDLAERCIKAGSKPGDTVLDPFGGAGTTGLVADRLNRNAILCELNPSYANMANERISADAPLFAQIG
jgi:site-specific DNA-methyltransferase (adenine-specific)